MQDTDDLAPTSQVLGSLTRAVDLEPAGLQPVLQRLSNITAFDAATDPRTAELRQTYLLLERERVRLSERIARLQQVERVGMRVGGLVESEPGRGTVFRVWFPLGGGTEVPTAGA